MRWAWLQWKDTGRPWVGLGTPCDSTDMDLFYAATTITVWDGRTTNFWHSPWLHGLKPKDIAPGIFSLSKCKKINIQKALNNKLWVSKINASQGFTVQLIQQFYDLWTELYHAPPLENNTPDLIVWNHTTSFEYSSSSAYKLQFEGAMATNMKKTIWASWAPPK